MNYKDAHRTLFGCAWNFVAQDARAARHYYWPSGYRGDYLGFRLVSNT